MDGVAGGALDHGRIDLDVTPAAALPGALANALLGLIGRLKYLIHHVTTPRIAIRFAD